MRWLTLLVSLPPTPTRHRVGVWRKLKRMGAVKLKGAAWILPETPETIELFQWLVEEIHAARGRATLTRLDRIQSIDYLESPLGRRARVRWETVSKRLQTMAARPRAATRQPHHALPSSGSTWVTRPRPHIDRIASAWLVKRFIDPHARFAF